MSSLPDNKNRQVVCTPFEESDKEIISTEEAYKISVSRTDIEAEWIKPLTTNYFGELLSVERGISNHQQETQNFEKKKWRKQESK